MKSGCTITTAIAIDRVLALYFPMLYYQQPKQCWSTGAFAVSILLAIVDWVVLHSIVTIQAQPFCSSFGCFTNDVFRAYWGLSNMLVNLLSCLLTMSVIYKLYRGSLLAYELERQNKHKIDKSVSCFPAVTRASDFLQLI
ncbi:hypothetical protein COOONC_03719, partial [Cooperia oncophora]